MATYHFSSDLLSKYVADDFIEWTVTGDQFDRIQKDCSGNPVPSSWTEAQDWAKARSEFLHSEATGYANSPNCGYYSLPLGYCDYHVDADRIIYATSSGTQFEVTKDEKFIVRLPMGRKLGFHHQNILLTLAGVGKDDRDRFEKMYLLPKSTPEAVKESLVKERAALYDSILMPHGYAAQKTVEEYVAARNFEREDSIVNEDNFEYEDAEEEYGDD